MSHLRLLLEHDANVEAVDGMGATPLFNAALQNSPECAEALLAKGARTDVRGYAGLTPVALACMKGHAEVLRTMIEHGKPDLSIVTGVKTMTALHCASNGSWDRAAGQDKDACVRILLEAGADVNAATDEGGTPLHSAVIEHDIETIRAMLEKGADPNREDDELITPFLVACKNGKVDLLKLMLERGAKADVRTKSGQGCLIGACVQGHPEAVRLLIEHGADVNAADEDGLTPVMAAAARNGRENAECAKILLEKGVDINAASKDDGITALMGAAIANSDKVADVLLNHGGVEVNAKAKQAMTAVNFAADKGSAEVLRLLLDHGADASIKSDDDGLPIHRATSGNHTVCLRMLLDANSTSEVVNGVTLRGETALHLATRRKREQEKERDGDSDGDDDDDEDKTPGEEELRANGFSGPIAMVELLLERKADPNIAAKVTENVFSARIALRFSPVSKTPVYK